MKFMGLIRPVTKKKILILILVLAVGGVLYWKTIGAKAQTPQYESQQVARGTVVSSISASGQITSGSSMPITSQATGIVSNVYVKDGDTVQAGQTIADLNLDLASQQKQAAAWNSYLTAKNNLNSAQADLNSLQSAEFKANQKFINDAADRDLATDDPTYIQENADWLQAEANYKNQQGVIDQSQAAVSSAWLNYQQLSSSITAPIAGTVSGLTVAPGSAVVSSGTGNSQSLGNVLVSGPLQAVVDLSEVDVTKVKIGQKATLTLDAFPGKTFAGKVASINTSGVVSSGVTNYPVTISLDSSTDGIYPNMAVTANIITDTKSDVLVIPSAAIQNQNGQNTVRILNNGKVTDVPVTTGISSDTEIEVVSGLNEGDNVVTGVILSGSTSSSGTRSVFSGGGFGGMGGGNMRFTTGGGNRGGARGG